MVSRIRVLGSAATSFPVFRGRAPTVVAVTAGAGFLDPFLNRLTFESNELRRLRFSSKAAGEIESDGGALRLSDWTAQRLETVSPREQDC